MDAIPSNLTPDPTYRPPDGAFDADRDFTAAASRRVEGAHPPSPAAHTQMVRLLMEMGRLQDEAARLRQRIAELEALADTDPLAEVLNRRAFLREFDRMIAFATRHGGAVSLIYLDLDDFKSVNDRFGHAAGDAVIRHVAALLRANTRACDLVGRMGGDEFTVGLSQADAAAAAARAQDLARTIQRTPAIHDDRPITVTCACGAEAVRPGQSADQVLARADAAMYARKHAAM